MGTQAQGDGSDFRFLAAAAVIKGDIVTRGRMVGVTVDAVEADAYGAAGVGLYFDAYPCSLGADVAEGQYLYRHADGAKLTDAVTGFPVAFALGAILAAATTAEVQFLDELPDRLEIWAPAGTPATGVAAETVIQTLTVPGGLIKQYDRAEVVNEATATGTTGTETARVRSRIDGLAGGVLTDTGAVDVANADEARGNASIHFTAAGASGSVKGEGRAKWSTTGVVAEVPTVLKPTAIDTSDDFTIVQTAQCSSTGETITGNRLGMILTRGR